jgi:hypothetical protein
VTFKVAAALAIGVVCAAVASCSPGSATTSTQVPPVTVLTRGADNGKGDIFLAPQCGGPSGGQYGTGPEIVSSTGKLIWFHPLPAGSIVTDFRTQTYLGQPVLTWFQTSAATAKGSYTTTTTSRSGTSSANSAWPRQTPTTGGCSPSSVTSNPDCGHRSAGRCLPQ